MSEWFEEWFNTEEYLSVYRHRNEDDAKNLFKLILDNIELKTGSKILDFACGAGRHSILFAKAGFDVTAVDISDNLLSVGRRNSEDLGLKINFIKSDLRTFSDQEKYNLVINLFTSFGYFETDEENAMVLKIAYQHLFENGYFILDFFNVFYLRNNIIPISYDKIDDGIIKQTRVFEKGRIIKKIMIAKRGLEKHYMESVRGYAKEELVSMLLESGFRIYNTFGDYDGKSFHALNSPRIIIIAKK